VGAFSCINSTLLRLCSLVFGLVRAAGFRDHVDTADSKLIARAAGARGAGRSSRRACCTGIASVNNDGVPHVSGEILPAGQCDLLTFFLFQDDRAALRTETPFELLIALGVARTRLWRTGRVGRLLRRHRVGIRARRRGPWVI